MISRFSGKYRWLSNFHPAVVEIDEMLYPTVEHAFQATKTQDIGERRKIQKADRPGKAKRMGHEVEIRSDWDDIKLEVMELLLREKFLSAWPGSDDLRQLLKETSPEVLVEGNNWNDWFFGAVPVQPYENGEKVQLREWCADDRDLWGHNHLGILLMELRDQILEEKTQW